MKSNQILDVSAWVCLLLLLGLCVAGIFLPTNLNIKEVYASPSMLPSDGDAWTENDNATYPWKVHPYYPDTIEFTTEEAIVGSYSLKVNHTSATTKIWIGLDIGEAYNYTENGMDVVIFWIKHKTWDYGNSLLLAYKNVVLWGSTDYWGLWPQVYGQRWIKVVSPINAWLTMNGNPDDTVRYFEFYYSGASSEGYETIYIDGLHFSEYDEPNFDSSTIDDTYLPNYYWDIAHFFNKKVVYNGNSYISVYTACSKETLAKGESTLENEYLGLTLWSLSLAYSELNSPTLLSQLKDYAEWLLQLENDTYTGAFSDKFDNSTKTFYSLSSSVCNGWALAGLSLLYSITGNTTYKTACDNARGHLIDRMWDEANTWFDSKINTTSGAITDATSWDYMRQGAIQLGLASYYRYVSQNSTVAEIVHKNWKNQYAPFGSYEGAHWRYRFSAGGSEDSTYCHWAMWQSYMAFGNQTYLDGAYYAVERSLVNYMIHNNSSQPYADWMADTNYDEDDWNRWDNWHGMGQWLWLELYDRVGIDKAQRLYENTTFGYYPAVWNSSNQLYGRYVAGGRLLNKNTLLNLFQPCNTHRF